MAKCLRISTIGRIGVLMFLSFEGSQVRAANTVITLDGAGQGRMFEGQGAMSAGGTSRLLIDYPEPYRSQILDYLFKPNYGASFQDLKVELGGDMNSTSGAEPSHMHSRADQNYNRGFQWWLMEQAKLRNPDISLGILSWGAPGWIGNGQFFSQDSIDYIINYIQGAKAEHNLTIDYVGVLNERPYNAYWIIQLKAALKAWGLNTKIIAADQSSAAIVQDMLTNPALMDAVDVVGFHYPRMDGGMILPNKPIWGSEDGLAWNWNGNWSGAAYLAKAYNRPYINSRITRHEVWSLVTSYYDMLMFPGSGQMYANTPWSGNYLVQPAIWATAHTNQFAGPGWQYIDNSCGFLGSGSFVTLRKGSDFSLIIENVDGAAAPVTFNIVNGLSTGTLHVWKSDQNAQFIQQDDIVPVNGSFSLNVAAGSIYSITTTTGQSKGNAAPPPPSAFPFPYGDTFENYPLDSQAKYFYDLNGSFEIANCAGGRSGLCFRQAAPAPPIPWTTIGPIEPSNVIGSTNWDNYQISADVFFEQPGTVKLMGKVSGLNVNTGDMYGYQLYVDYLGNWSLKQGNFVSLVNGSVPFNGGSWHTLNMVFDTGRIRVVIDGTTVADRATDSTFARGMAGLGTQGWTTAQFDNFRIDPIPGAGTPVPPTQMSVTATGEAVGYEAVKAIDGDLRTFWNSPFTCAGGCAPSQPLPQSLTLALGGTYRVARVRYTPRQDNNQSGYITSYNIYVSSDGANFTKVASGTWPVTAAEKAATFNSVSASFVKFEAVTGIGGLAAVSEIQVDYDPNEDTTNPAPMIGSLTPSAATVGSAGFVLSVSGANFVPGATVRWNGTDRATTYVNSTTLNATILNTDLASEGTANVSAFNPSPGGGVSSAKTFTISPTGGGGGSTPPPVGIPLVAGFSSGPSALRNDFSGWVGTRLTIGATPLTVTSVGRICVSGNTGTHQVKLVNASNGVELPGGSASLSMAGCAAGQFVYTTLAAPISLAPSTSYYLVSQETQGGDRWYDQGLISAANVVTVNNSVYSSNGTNWTWVNASNTSFVPPNLLYATTAPSAQYLLTTNTAPASSGTVSVSPSAAGNLYNSGAIVKLTAVPASGCVFNNWTGGSPDNPLSATMSAPQTFTANFTCTAPPPPPPGSAFVAAYSQTILRNDFTGWVGMQLQVGSKPLTVTSVGRICAAGNSTTHVVKFVNAANSSDVPGSSTPINMSGCTSGQFLYATLPNPITLAAGSRYFLASQEVQGGDRWYELGAIASVADASVIGGIYQFGSSAWNVNGGPNTSYVPTNFRYSTSAPTPIAVTIQSNPVGSKISVDGVEYSTTQAFNWNSGESHTIAASAPQGLGAGAQIAWSSWSDGGSQSHTVSPTADTTFTANFTTQYQLTRNVSPVSSGSITANPPSSSGYYTSGTSVQLTAASAANCTFVNWSDDSTDNPRSITMSAPQSLTANFTCQTAPPPPPPPPANGFITGFSPSALRNDFSGWVGMHLTVGASPLTVNSVGRICVAGNTQTHNVKFVSATSGADLALASVNMTGCTPGQFVYATLASSITLSPSVRYFLVSEELQGGDRWYDRTAVTETSVATVNGNVFRIGTSNWTGSTDGTSYVPTDFLYSIAAPDPNAPFVSNASGTATRNDFTGWVGMKLTVGANPITVKSIGRMCAAGNTGTHNVKFVNSVTGADVPGASVPVSMSGCSSRQFVYADLPAPITLQPGTSYYLVSQETSGGDRWFDLAPITGSSAGTINSAIYNSGAAWSTIGSANFSYVPPNFK